MNAQNNSGRNNQQHGDSGGGAQQSGQTSERRSLGPAHSVNTFVLGVGRHKYGVPDSEFAKLGLPERDLAATAFAIKEGIAKARGLKLIPKRGLAEWCSLTKMESTYNARTKPISRRNALTTSNLTRKRHRLQTLKRYRYKVYQTGGQ